MKTRLFIGNLASTVTDEELRTKFEALLAGHKGEAEVGNVEVRCKNDDNYFGYVDVHLQQDQPDNGSNSKDDSFGGGSNNIDLMNNTKWKGSLIKVQLAKESFIDKLKREQQANRIVDDTGRPAVYNKSTRIYTDNVTKPNCSGKNNEANISEQSRIQKQADDVLRKLDRTNERRNSKFSETKKTFRTDATNCGFEIVSKDTVSSNSHLSPSNYTVSPTKPTKKRKKVESSSSEDESDDNFRDGIPKFKGLLQCYPGGIPEVPPPLYDNTEDSKILEDNGKEETLIQKKLLSLAFEKDAVEKLQIKEAKAEIPISLNRSTINFKKNKQQLSDLLRLQSLEKMKQLKDQRKNLIKSSLSSVPVFAPLTEQRKILSDGKHKEDNGEEETTQKRSKMSLFDNDDSEQDGDEDGIFNVKQQFEGEEGQKLLELKTRWGNDDRFKIDDRFKESDVGEEVEPAEQEKEKQLDILTDILGKRFSSKSGTDKKKGMSASVIMHRYDPEAEEENDTEETESAKVKKTQVKQSKMSKETNKKSDSAESAEKTIRSTEPATFKTVSNLKTLFSSSGAGDDSARVDAKTPVFNSSVVNQQASFSLLAAFGTANDDNKADNLQHATAINSGIVGAPRNFWQSNPFRYDSSDDEEESEKSKGTTGAEKNKITSTLVAHRKTPFFFVENDDRFDGLEDYFLLSEGTTNVIGNGEDGAAPNETKKESTEDFALKRQELKSIVKAKIRNTRRKDEKRTLAIKRAIRNRKKKVYQKGRQY